MSETGLANASLLLERTLSGNKLPETIQMHQKVDEGECIFVNLNGIRAVKCVYD